MHTCKHTHTHTHHIIEELMKQPVIISHHEKLSFVIILMFCIPAICSIAETLNTQVTSFTTPLWRYYLQTTSLRLRASSVTVNKSLGIVGQRMATSLLMSLKKVSIQLFDFHTQFSQCQLRSSLTSLYCQNSRYISYAQQINSEILPCYATVKAVL